MSWLHLERIRIQPGLHFAKSKFKTIVGERGRCLVQGTKQGTKEANRELGLLQQLGLAVLVVLICSAILLPFSEGQRMQA